MIKPEEIRRGNLLKYKEDIITVLGIDPYDFIWFLDPSGDMMYNEKIEDFEPIKIGEEISIEDCGFEWDEKHVCYYNHPISLEDLIVGFAYTVNWPIKIEFNYIHILQNLYAILSGGKELSIKLK